MAWLADVLAGLALAAVFYALVRLRMRVAPAMLARFGAWARWTTWVLVGALMVLAANLALIALRILLHDHFQLTAPFFHELAFAAVAFGAGFWLVSWHVSRNRSNNPARRQGSGCGANAGQSTGKELP